VSRLLIPTGRWKIEAEPAIDQPTIRLTGRAAADAGYVWQQMQTVLLTPDQAHLLISELNGALCELELQRAAALARAAEGEGTTDGWD
jgi:hypothetical protein